ncbi:hypothetical protein PTKIN_Ptkin01aG0240800 [Pterospermum kingtungense]
MEGRRLVTTRNSTKRQIEKLGSMYFQDLVLRSFFQISNRNKSRYVIHDLINDLTQSAAGEKCFRVEGDKPLKTSSRARYSSYIGSRYNGLKMFDTFYEAEHLRTFLPFMLPKDGDCFLTNNVLIDLLPRLRRLTVFSLEGYYISELPNSIGANLWYLDIADANSIEGMPFGIGELTDLQFCCRPRCWISNKRAEELSDLKGQISISRLENLVNAQDALEARLFDKSSLDDLEIKWNADLKDNLRKARVEKEVLSLLQPHKKLKKLSIKFYGGLTFPTRIGDPSFKNLICLNFGYCKNCASFPSVEYHF